MRLVRGGREDGRDRQVLPLRHGYWEGRLAAQGSVAAVNGAWARVSVERLRFAIVVAFLLICVLGGGASRSDVTSLLYLRPAAILCIAGLALTPGPWAFRTIRVPLLLLGLFAVVIAIQLIPLPPDLWAALPGRERYLEAAAAAGMDQPWRPISLTPDLTLNSLLALLPPLAALVGIAALNREQRYALLPILIAVACASAVLGIAQLNAGSRSPVFLYNVTHDGSAVGFFANRNHQAALLAITLPMLRVWTLGPAEDAQWRQARSWIAAGTGLFLIPMILVTGSRAGVALGAIGIFAAFMISPRIRISAAGAKGRILRLLAWTAPVLMFVAVLVLGRAIAIQRLATDWVETEQRLAQVPVMMKMLGDSFPFGSGFGSFDPVFRNYEPDQALDPRYFNHAHNDLLELALTGGLPALIIFVAFVIWWAWNGYGAFVPLSRTERSVLFRRLGSVIILILFMASLVDYPLRTPLMGVILAFACGWLAHSSSRAPRAGREIEPDQ